MSAHDSSQMWQTMSIASAGESVLRAAPKRAAGAGSGAGMRSTGLFTGDIQGAAPRSKQRARAGPTDLTLRTDDVSGAAPATLHRSYKNKPDFALNTHDIDGAYAAKHTYQSQRHSDPLVPNYDWDKPSQESKPRATTPPRFLRDSYRIDDIEGARPKQHVRGAARASMDVSDISGATVRPSQRAAAHNRTLDVSDILSDGKRKPQRMTDPQAPVHTIHGMVVKDDELSAPRSRHRETNTPFYALSTHDIEGAVPGWKPKHKMGGVAPEKRRHFRNTNYVGDINGTTAGTRQRGLRSNRVTDPNAPSYTPLEGRAYRAPGAHNGMARRAGDPAATRQRAADPKEAEIVALRQQVAALERRARVQDHVRASAPKVSAATNAQAAAAVASLPDL